MNSTPDYMERQFAAATSALHYLHMLLLDDEMFDEARESENMSHTILEWEHDYRENRKATDDEQ